MNIVTNAPRPNGDSTQQNGETTYLPSKILPPPENLEANSTHRLSRMEIQKAITDVKRFVEARLESDLNLVRVSNKSCNPCVKKVM